jgi:hypothetical protein
VSLPACVRSPGREDRAELAFELVGLLVEPAPGDSQRVVTELDRERIADVVLLDPVPLSVILSAVELDDQLVVAIQRIDAMAVPFHLELRSRQVPALEKHPERVVQRALARRLVGVDELGARGQACSSRRSAQSVR